MTYLYDVEDMEANGFATDADTLRELATEDSAELDAGQWEVKYLDGDKGHTSVELALWLVVVSGVWGSALAMAVAR